MDYLNLIKVKKLMGATTGIREIKVGLIDGPVVVDHPDIDNTNIKSIDGNQGACYDANSVACIHGTFIAGILSGKRGSQAPSICPGSTLLLCPIFVESSREMPSATPRELAGAIIKCIDAGARLLNLSVGLTPTTKGQNELKDSLDYAAKRGVLVIAAAGNDGTLGSSVITRHPWVIPVVGCDIYGNPVDQSNLGISIGRGLRAPGWNVTSLAAGGSVTSLGGTSVATPFVTGTAALLWSMFPTCSATRLKMSLRPDSKTRREIVPPLIDAWTAYEMLVGSESL